MHLSLWCFDILGSVDPGRTPLPGLLTPGEQTTHLSDANQPIQRQYPQPPISLALTLQGCNLPALHPSARCQTTRDSYCVQSLQTDSKQPTPSLSLKPVTLPLRFFLGKQQGRLQPTFPPNPFCLLTHPGASPGALMPGLVCTLLLVTESNKPPFKWWLSPDILASPCLNKNKTFILRHFFNKYSFL